MAPVPVVLLVMTGRLTVDRKYLNEAENMRFGDWCGRRALALLCNGGWLAS